ncbi:hypothetical protein DVH05_003023 [Phytophthora capsici]|nr:hypothetical protein DVH05_003023 [Phytophthora capsici]
MNSIRRRTEEQFRDLVVYSNEELRQMDRSLNFEIPDSAQLRTMTEQAVVKMNVYQHEELACAVCEMLHEGADLNRQKLSPQLLQAMRRCLAVPEGSNIPKMIVEQYCASEIDARLHGLLLYPPDKFDRKLRLGFRRFDIAPWLAVSIGDENVTLVDLCGTCLRYLSCSSESKPPTLSIANGNYIGRMPAKYASLTRTDEQSIALVVPCVSLSTLTGGSCKVLKSHHYIVKNTEGPIVDMLPRDLTGTVRVTMIGSMTSAQRAACRKRYELNIPLCRDVLQFLAVNNKLYQKQRSRLNLNWDDFAGTARTELVIDRTSNSENPIDDERITQNLRDDSTYSSFGSTVLDGIDTTIEQTEISSSKLLLQNYGLTTDVLVRKSNAYSNTRNWGSVAEMFPTLFPGGGW